MRAKLIAKSTAKTNSPIVHVPADLLGEGRALAANVADQPRAIRSADPVPAVAFQDASHLANGNVRLSNVLQGVIAVHEVEALVGEIEGQRVSDPEVGDPSCIGVEVVLQVDAGHRCTERLSQYRGFDSFATTDDEQCLDA